MTTLNPKKTETSLVVDDHGEARPAIMSARIVETRGDEARTSVRGSTTKGTGQSQKGRGGRWTGRANESAICRWRIFKIILYLSNDFYYIFRMDVQMRAQSGDGRANEFYYIFQISNYIPNI